MLDYKVVALGLARLIMVSEISYVKILFSGGENCEGPRNWYCTTRYLVVRSQRVNESLRIIFFAPIIISGSERYPGAIFGINCFLIWGC